MKILQNRSCQFVVRLIILTFFCIEAFSVQSAFDGRRLPFSPEFDRSYETISERFYLSLKTSQTTESDEPLRTGESVERSIKSEETNRFSIELRSKQVFRVDLKEKGVDVTLGIYLNGKNDKLVVAQSNFGLGFSRERCSLIVEQPGKYTIYIKASKSASAGSYQFISSLKEEAGENDQKELEAQKLLTAGLAAKTFDDAINKWQQAKSKWTELGDAYWAGYTGNLLGVISNALGRNRAAMEFYAQALSFMMSAADLSGESQIRANIGKVYSDFGNKPKALNYYKQSLTLDQQTGDLIGQSITLNNIGSVLTDMAHPEQALDYHKQALPLFDKTGDEIGRATTFNNLGRAYETMGENQTALNYYNDEALPIFRRMRQTRGALRGQATVLNNIAGIYYSLGDKKTALKYFEDALPFSEKIGDKRGQATTYNNLGIIHNERGETKEALECLKEKALPLWIASEDKVNQATTLNAIGLVYLDLDKKETALDYFEKQALPLWIEEHDKGGQATTLNNIGTTYYSSGDVPAALKAYKQAMPLWIEVADKRGQALTLSNMMVAWAGLNNPRLAILYGKTSLKPLQTLRTGIKKADTELQKSFVRSIQNSYQSLAELLIKEKQFDQAVHVLNLYRAQQFFDFDAGNGSSVESLDLSEREQEFADHYAAFFGNSRQINLQIDELIQDLSDHEPTKTEKEQLQKLKNELQTTVDKFSAALNEAETNFSKRDKTDEVRVTNNARGISDFLKTSNQHAVVIYTLIGAEEFHLLLIDKDGIRHFPVPVKGKVLSEKAKEFARLITNVDSGTGKPNIDVTDQAKDLYDIIFRPIAKALPKDTTTIMWNLDGNLRYVPINALHDGKDYLVRRKLNNVVITRTDLKRATQSPNPVWQATGFAVIKEMKQVRNIDIPYSFPALIAGKSEINGIFNGRDRKNVVFEGKPFIDLAFTRDVMLRELRKELPVVHISSHFKIQPGDLSRSFLVLGDGNAFSLLDMKKEAESFPERKLFSKVDLLTLSACDTGVSETDGDGAEVDSFAELAQRFGAASVLATLWSVNECSTAEFMKLFYRNKIERGMNKAEAVRQAQLALLDRKGRSVVRCEVGKGEVTTSNSQTSETTRTYKAYKGNPAEPFAHPYYWSPFILYGNWK